ncbi:MAG: TldD/PmbA family protein [Oscillospiraceae bacterium]|nr:TldD/PmbA family protein [Oscillospiraceae bacterium]
MLDTIKKKLAALGCDAWELTETTNRGWEFYIIRDKLDQNRATEVKTIRVSVYKSIENGKFLGSASGDIPPTASEAEIDERLASLLYQAGLVKNPYYTLADKPVDVPEKRERVDVEQIAESFLRAIRSVEQTKTEDINSYEIFVSEITRHTLNSNGVEYTCTYPKSTVDMVVNARRDGHEIELYRFYTSGTCDAEKLKSDISDVLRFGRDRLTAVPTPKLGTGAVVFSTGDAVEIYDYFLARMSTAMKYRKISDWELGKPVVEDAQGDKISVKALSSLANSSRDFPVDEEGSVIRDRWIIRDGVAENFFGSRQFSEYLGVKDSSIVYNVRFEGGRASAEEIRGGDYLEVVEFSDFQIDEMGGDIAGEIRVAYWHHDGKTTVVTGGSVSGNMREAARTMTFSRETRQYDTHVIPAVTRLEGLRITGVADME